MECNLLIDLGESPNSMIKDSEKGITGSLDSSTNAVSHNGVSSNAASNDILTFDNLSEAKAQHIPGERRASPFGCPLMKFKAQSVESLSVSAFNGLGVLPLLRSQIAARRPQSVNLDQLVAEDSSSASLLSPFASLRPTSIPSLPAENLLDVEPSKILSPFGWTPRCNDQMTINEAIQVEDVPIGHLVQVQESESTLPDDMFDINTLGRKQLEHSKSQPNGKLSPAVKVLLPSLPSIGSEGAISNDTLNRGFMESVLDESDRFPTPNDSVFEEAQILSKVFQTMATEASCSSLDSIENEDGSILNDCPDWKEECVEGDSIQQKHVEVLQKTLNIYSKVKTIDKEGVTMIENYRKPSVAFSDPFMISPESEFKNLSFSSSISAISPPPLSSDRVENMKLKAKTLFENQLNAGPLKLRASSCSSMPQSKPGPLKAFVPLQQVIKNEVSTPNTLRVHRSFSTETPHLQTMNSPVERINITPRMSSTPKPHAPDISNNYKDKLNNGSSLKKSIGNKFSKSEQVCNSGTKKSTGKSVVSRSSSLGKLNECQKVGASEVGSAKSSVARPMPLSKKLSIGSPAVETSVFPRGNRHTPSPLLKRKMPSSSPVIKTPSRSVSTGSLASTSSIKKMPSLQSHGKSNSTSSKLPLCHTGRPLAETSVNSPAKHGSPFHKLVSKFHRTLGPKGMKENMHPV